MAAEVTIVAVREQGGPDRASGGDRLDELQAELAGRLGSPVEVFHGRIAEAPASGALLVFCGSLAEAMTDVPAEVAARVIWMAASRTHMREGLERYGLLGAVERFRYVLWVRARSQERAHGLHVRGDVAGGLAGASARTDAAAGYVVLSDARYRDLVSLIAAVVRVADGRPAPAPDRPPEPEVVPAFPIGQVLEAGGEWGQVRIVRAIGGGPERGVYEARRVAREEQRAIVTLGLRQTAAWERTRGELELPAEGFAPLLGVVRIEREGSEYDAMIEAGPGGVPLPELLPGPISAWQAARILLPVVGWVAAAHRQGRVVVGLRPETVFVAYSVAEPDDGEIVSQWGLRARPRPTGVVPRFERFLATAGRPCHGVGPAFESLYLAPEVLAGRAPGPAADVFSLAAILARMTLGADPFSGATLIDRVTAVMTGAWTRHAGPDGLAALLTAALEPDPGVRVGLWELEARLADLAAL